MRGTRIVGLGTATALLLGAGFAAAQGTPPPETPSPAAQTQPGQTSSPDHTIPPPPEAQPQAPIADQSKPAAVGPAQADTASSMPTEGPPGATGQTMPSTISAENAALDKLPIVALQLPLSDEEKAQIVNSLGSAPNAPAKPAKADLDTVGVADFLPWDVEPQEFPEKLTQQLPRLQRYKYVNDEGRMLIVDPPISTVVGEVKR